MKMISLCSPDQEKSCFACCPPIRPARYEHHQYKNIMKRILRENTRNFDVRNAEVSPITGFSCWALGYLDQACKRVGCLLHPVRHGGIDLRYRVDYGDKCRRETCPEAKLFSQLETGEQKFWLRLAEDLDSFSYSSRTLNPLFRLIEWGIPLLRLMAAVHKEDTFTCDSFFIHFPFFETTLRPRANAYLLNGLIHPENVFLLKGRPFREAFEGLSARVFSLLKKEIIQPTNGTPVHLLDLDKSFSDLLRLFLGPIRMEKQEALRLKGIVDRQVRALGERLPCG